jgi:thiaminase
MKTFLNECLRPLEKACDEFPWNNKEAYANYLAQIYYYVSHSTRLLAFAAARFRSGDEKFHRRFLEHAAEEKGHQTLAVNDIKAMGLSLQSFPELPATSALYESQYYKIEFQDPMAFLGYILVLEGLTVSRGAMIEKIVKEAFGKSASTFIHVHASEDPDHLTKALAQIESLDERRKALVKQNVMQTAAVFQMLLSSCQSQKQERHLRAA